MQNQLSHEKKTALLSMKYWLFDRDPYNLVKNQSPHSLSCEVFHPPKQLEAFFFIAPRWVWEPS